MKRKGVAMSFYTIPEGDQGSVDLNALAVIKGLTAFKENDGKNGFLHELLVVCPASGPVDNVTVFDLETETRIPLHDVLPRMMAAMSFPDVLYIKLSLFAYALAMAHTAEHRSNMDRFMLDSFQDVVNTSSVDSLSVIDADMPSEIREEIEKAANRMRDSQPEDKKENAESFRVEGNETRH